jgi:DNA-binding transcriptional ArsR family regulator
VTAQTESNNRIEQLAHLLKSPIRVKALAVLIERVASPKDISVELGVSLTTVSHHVQELLKMNLIELVDEQPRRGAVAHFYRAVMRPIWSDEEWGELSQEERQRYAAWVMQLINCDVAEAMDAGTFQAHTETHTSRSLFHVDEQGWQELNRIQNEALEASFEVEAASAERLAEEGADGINVRTVMLCIEMPPGRPRGR